MENTRMAFGDNKKSGLGGFGKGLSMKIVHLPTMDNDMDEDDDESMFKPEMDVAGDFIGRLLMAAPVIHMLHLQTDSYAKHIALNSLYDSLPGDVDTIAEEFQGMYGIIQSYGTYAPFNASPIAFVEELLSYVNSKRSCMGPSSSIQSNIDVLTTSLKSCLYKLKHLK